MKINACISALLLIFAVPTVCAAASAPIPVKVVVVTMFENGKLTGDKPGEAQFWVERQKMDRIFPFPMGEYELRMNSSGLLLICTGGGISNATSSIMALGMDGRFDLSNPGRGKALGGEMVHLEHIAVPFHDNRLPVHARDVFA